VSKPLCLENRDYPEPKAGPELTWPLMVGSVFRCLRRKSGRRTATTLDLPETGPSGKSDV
jgi:hypothetical protein